MSDPTTRDQLRNMLIEASVKGASQGVLSSELRRRFDAGLDAIEAEARADALDVERLKTIHHPVTNPMCAGDTVTDVSTSDDTPAWLGDLRAMLGIEDERVLLDMLERDPVLRQQVYDAVQAIDARVRAEVAAQVRNLQPRGMSTPASVGYGEAIGDVLALLEGAR